MAEKSILPGFKCLGPSIYLNSATPFSQPSTNSPDLILLTSWTGASPKHISKYTTTYTTLYPSTPILLITTAISDLTLKSTSQKSNVLTPAVSYLRIHHSHSRILLHCFSEGGANKAACLASAYLTTTSHRLPISACILDSTPGRPKYTSNLTAYRRSLPANPILRAISLPLGAVVLAVTWLIFAVFVGKEENVISRTRRALNDERLWDVKGSARTYVFSQADELIAWRDVEDHAVEAAEVLGLTSLVVRYEGSGHCAHVREDEGVYWGAVRRTWDVTAGEAGEGDKEERG